MIRYNVKGAMTEKYVGNHGVLRMWCLTEEPPDPNFKE